MRSADYASYGDRLAPARDPGVTTASTTAAATGAQHTVRELLTEYRHPSSYRDDLPGLIPIYGHRYVVAEQPCWVLSVVKNDAVYGQHLRDYLLHELHDILAQRR